MTNEVLVVTTVHNPNDARIRFRQIDSLLSNGWQVTYAAPFTANGLDLKHQTRPGLHVIDLPRAVGRRRLKALASARALLRDRGNDYDIVLIHDPELLLSYLGSGLKNVVLDVHEDAAAAIVAKEWIPRILGAPIYRIVRAFEAWAERRMPLLLAEYEYQERFKRPHPVVPNAVKVPRTQPQPGSNRVVYLGALTLERGAQQVVGVAEKLKARNGAQITVDVIGPAHGAAHEVIQAAHDQGLLTWHGFVASDQALTMLDGAIAGLSLLHDVPNYRHSMPTKILEYMAHAVPVITTPLPMAVTVVEEAGSGRIVPFGDVEEAVQMVEELHADQELVVSYGERGYLYAKKKYDWNTMGDEFVQVLRNYVK